MGNFFFSPKLHEAGWLFNACFLCMWVWQGCKPGRKAYQSVLKKRPHLGYILGLESAAAPWRFFINWPPDSVRPWGLLWQSRVKTAPHKPIASLFFCPLRPLLEIPQFRTTAGLLNLCQVIGQPHHRHCRPRLLGKDGDPSCFASGLFAPFALPC